MLARVAQAKFAAVFAEHRLVVLGGDPRLLGQQWRPGIGAAGERRRDPSRQPRRAIGTPPDHHAIGARRRQRLTRILDARDVAVDDHGDRDSQLHRTHSRPVGFPLEEFVAGAAVNRDELNARLLRPARQFRSVEAGAVPAQPHLQRHGHLDRRDHRIDKRHRQIEIAHQRRPTGLARHFARRTAHVDVDDLGAQIDSDPRAFRHPLRLAAGELHHERPEAFADCLAQHVSPRPDQLGARHHLRNDQPGAQILRQPAERQVRHARHRRQQHRVRRLQIPNRKFANAHRSVICLFYVHTLHVPLD